MPLHAISSSSSTFTVSLNCSMFQLSNPSVVSIFP
jgi:hypothetical protein